MKIVHIAHCYWPAEGRAEKFLQEISEHLARRGHEVKVYTSGGMNLGPKARFEPPYLPPGETVIGGVAVKRYALDQPRPLVERSARLLKYLPWLGDYLSLYLHGPILPGLLADLKKEKPDLIMAAALPMYNIWLAWRIARLTRTPLVLAPFYHPSQPRLYRKPLFHFLLKQAGAVLVGSEAERTFLIERGIKPQDLFRIGYGVEPVDPPPDAAMKWRNRLRLPAEAQIVLFSGRLLPSTGVFTLLRAIPLVWQHFPHTYFVIAGRPADAPDKIRQKIDELGPRQDQVVLLTAAPDQERKTLFSLGDIFVSPGREDAWPVGILASWLAGRPVVACQDGPGRELVSPGQDGWLTRFGSAIDLACAIAKLLKDPAVRSRLGQNGRQKVLSSLTWQAAADRVEKVYQEVTKS